MPAKRAVRLLIILGLLFLAGSDRALAQENDPVTELAVAYTFGEQVTIRGVVDASLEIKSIDIQLAFSGDPGTLIAPIFPNADGSFTYVHQVSDRFIPAFTEVLYSFLITTSNEAISTPFKSFQYTDNRFDWFELETNAINVHWYAGDTAYATRILDAARAGMNRAAALLAVDPPEKIDLYAYAGLEEYQFSRGQFGQRWAGGHADPSIGLILVSLPPDEAAQLEIERKIPHEVAHILLYEATGAGFWNLPAWLNEGFASMLETTPNADYAFLAAQAAGAGDRIPLADLCDGFPGDASGALLAYAESTQFVTYLADVYGPAGLRAVIESYASGAGCTQGTAVGPVGQDLAALEAAWLASLVDDSPAPVPPAGTERGDMTPSLFVLAVVIAGPVLVLVGSGLRRKTRHAR